MTLNFAKRTPATPTGWKQYAAKCPVSLGKASDHDLLDIAATVMAGDHQQIVIHEATVDFARKHPRKVRPHHWLLLAITALKVNRLHETTREFPKALPIARQLAEALHIQAKRQSMPSPWSEGLLATAMPSKQIDLNA